MYKREIRYFNLKKYINFKNFTLKNKTYFICLEKICKDEIMPIDELTLYSEVKIH